MSIAFGMSEAALMAQIEGVVSLGGGSTGFANWGEAMAAVNDVAGALALATISDRMPASVFLGRLNAIFAALGLPANATAYWDFVNGRYWHAGGSAAPPCDRDSAGLALDSAGIWQSFGADTLRRTDLGLTLEAAGAGLFLHNADVESSSWGKEGGLAPTAGGAGPIAGRNYTSLTRTSGNGRISQTPAAVNGTPHSVVFMGRGNPTYRYAIIRNNAVAVGAFRNYVFDAQTLTVKAQGAGAANSRITGLADGFVMASVDLTAGFSGTVGWYFYFSNVEPVGDAFQAPTVAGSWDFAYADALTVGSSPIISGAAVGTRAADAVPLELPAGVHDLTVRFADDSTQLLEGKSGTFILPTNLNRATIKTVMAVAA